MYLRYAVVFCPFITAAVVIVISANSYSGTDECRNINEPFNMRRHLQMRSTEKP
jgi:hypothetical protein